MNREEFESLEPALGLTAAYQIFAIQSDEFIHRHNILYIRESHYIRIDQHTAACEIVDSLELYRKFILTDEPTYLRLITTARRYIPPTATMTRSLCSKIVTIRPDFIPFMNDSFLDTGVYLNYIRQYDIRNFGRMSLSHFRNKEFLFHCWSKTPKLLLHNKFKSLFTYELLSEFSTLPPYLARLYSRARPIPSSKLTEEILISELNRGRIPKGKIAPYLFTPEIISKIINIDIRYMVRSEYRRKYVTKELFLAYYVPHIKLFPHYITTEILSTLYQQHSLFYPEYARTYDILHQIMADNNSYICSIYDRDIICKLVAHNADLTPYVYIFLKY